MLANLWDVNKNKDDRNNLTGILYTKITIPHPANAFRF